MTTLKFGRLRDGSGTISRNLVIINRQKFELIKTHLPKISNTEIETAEKKHVYDAPGMNEKNRNDV